MRKRMQGSFTIEASVIVPLIVVVFAVIMQMLFYYHDKNILIATASECVVIGSDKDLFLQMIDGKLLLLTDVTVEIERSEDQISLLCRASHGKMALQVERHMIQTEPERYIREILKRKEQIGK